MFKNFYLSFITLISQLLSVSVLLLVLARIFDLNEFGIFSFSLVLASSLMTIIDFGYPLKLSKDTAENVNNISAIVFKSSLVKVINIPILLLVVYTLYLSSFIAKDEFIIAILLIFASLCNSFTRHLLIPFRSVDKYSVEMKTLLQSNLTLLIVVVSIAAITANIYYTSIAFLSIRFLFLIYTIKVFIDHFGIKKDMSDIKSEIRSALPYAFQVGIGVLYLNIDTIILKKFVTNSDIAIYQAGMQIVMVAMIFNNNISNVLVPALAHSFSKMKDISRKATKANYLSLGIGALGALILYIFGNTVIEILYGSKFFQLNELIIYFSILIFLRYFVLVYGILLTISNHQKLRTKFLFYSLLSIIILDLYFIPDYFMQGALTVLIVGHLFLAILYISSCYKIFGKFFFATKGLFEHS